MFLINTDERIRNEFSSFILDQHKSLNILFDALYPAYQEDGILKDRFISDIGILEKLKNEIHLSKVAEEDDDDDFMRL